MLFIILIGLVVFCIVFGVIFLMRKQRRDRRAKENFEHIKEKGDAFLADAVKVRRGEEISFNNEEDVRLNKASRPPVSFEETMIYRRSPKTKSEPFSIQEDDALKTEKSSVDDPFQTEASSADSSEEQNTVLQTETKSPRRRRRTETLN